MLYILIVITFAKINIPSIPGNYMYKTSNGVSYIGTTNNLARRFKEHLYANHPYAHHEFSFWKLKDVTQNQRYGLEKELINKYKPKYNKISGCDGFRLKTLKSTSTINDLFELDSHLLDISLRELIATGITIYLEYHELKEQHNRQSSFLKHIDVKYNSLKNKVSKTLDKIKQSYLLAQDNKKNIINIINNEQTWYGRILNYFKISSVSSHRKLYIDIRYEIIKKIEEARYLISEIEKKIEAEKSYTIAKGLGALALNLILPGFGLIEAVAIGSAVLSASWTYEFINICNDYINNLNNMIDFLNIIL